MVIDPRDGAPKHLTPPTPHSGMHHRANGKLIAGISKTQAAHPLDDSKQLHAPGVAKNSVTTPFVPVHDACDAALMPHARAELRNGEGRAVLNEAETAFLPRLTREK